MRRHRPTCTGHGAAIHRPARLPLQCLAAAQRASRLAPVAWPLSRNIERHWQRLQSEHASAKIQITNGGSCYNTVMHRVTTYPANLADLFRQFVAACGILEFAVFMLEPDEQPDYQRINAEALQAFRPQAVEGREFPAYTFEPANMRSDIVTTEI